MLRNEFVDPAIAMVRKHHPDLHDQVVSIMAGLWVRLDSPDETFRLGVSGRELRTAPPGEAGVVVHACPLTMLRLLDHETTLLDELHSGALDLVGALGDLLTLESALYVFLNACVRSPEAPNLLLNFRRYCKVIS